jgi:hypothetical protein
VKIEAALRGAKPDDDTVDTVAALQDEVAKYRDLIRTYHQLLIERE